MRVFLDANVLFSAAYQDRSGLLVFFELAGTSVMQLTSSAFAIEEARRNIALKRPERIAAYERLIAELSPAPAPPGELIAIAQAAELPPKDAPILAAALAPEADLLVTGDRTHFGRLFGKAVGRLTVRQPADALAAIVHATRLKAAQQHRK